MLLPLLGLLGLIVFVFISFIGSAYQNQIRRARNRVFSNSKMLETTCGSIEYAEAGKGPPVLVIHGAGGGIDQGLDLGADLVQRGFHVIAMSRFGYLRTPLPQDGSAEAQADAHAAVLDALDIPRCAVFGVSAGGPSAMQLALRHPDRVTSLVLMVPAVYSPHPEIPIGGQGGQGGHGGQETRRMSKLVGAMMDLTLRSDFLFWSAMRLAPRTMTRVILGTPPELLDHADAAEHARVQVVLDHILPVAPRRLGLVNDAAVVPNLSRFDLERLDTPTLIISARDCLYQTFAGSQYSAEHMPNAHFIGYETGGHLLVGHQQETTDAVADFLKAAPATVLTP